MCKNENIIKELLDNDYDIILIQKGEIVRGYGCIDEENLKNDLYLYNLSKREQEILELLSLGLSNKEISKKLNVSISTVKNHVYSIFKKLNVSDRTQAAMVAINNHKV